MRPNPPSRARLALLFLFLVGTSPSPAADLHVPADYPTVQSALNAALFGDEVLVSPGRYLENLRIRGRVAILRSSFGNPDDTILDGSPGSDDGAPVIDVDLTESYPSFLVIEGFTIEEGAAGISTVGDRTYLVIRNNVIQDNSPHSGIRNALATIIVQESRFLRNVSREGGGAIRSQGPCTVERNFFRDNRAISPPYWTDSPRHRSGGAIYEFGGSDPSMGLNVRDNTFIGNECNDYGGAICAITCTPIIERNWIVSNTGTACAGGIYAFDTVGGVVRENVLVGNKGLMGAGMGFEKVRQLEVRNNTVYDSRGYGDADGIRFRDGASACLLKNNLVVGGAGYGIHWSDSSGIMNCNDSFGNALADYEGPVTGQDNISLDPLFCDASFSDFTLRTGSPCLPANNACGTLIGARDEGCSDTVQIEQSTWARILELYRER